MKLTSFTALLAAGLALAATALAQNNDTLRVFTAIEVEFPTETNKFYTLQGSSTLTNWTDISEPVFGNGRTVDRFFSTRSGGEVKFDLYRVSVTESTNVNLAPWTFGGVSLALGDEAARSHFDFLTETNGVKVSPAGSDPFSYAFTKSGENEVQADLTFPSGKRYLFTFNFTTPLLGTYVRDEFRVRTRTYYGQPQFTSSELRDRKVGTFQILTGITPPTGGTGGTNTPPTGTNAVPVAPPTSLAGLAYSFLHGASPDRLEFGSATNGIEIEDNERPGDDHPGRAFAYAYTTTDTNTATLVVTFSAIRRDEYDLTFTDGAQGTFVRREFRNGLLDETDTGSFSPSSIPPVVVPPTPGNCYYCNGSGGDDHGGGTGGTGGTGTPPPTGGLTGDAFTFASGATPERLVFQTATTGTQFDDSSPSPFTYTYAPAGEHAASLVVRFKSDRWDEYDLTFTADGAGTFVRREFKKSVLADTDTGTFSRTTGN